LFVLSGVVIVGEVVGGGGVEKGVDSDHAAAHVAGPFQYLRNALDDQRPRSMMRAVETLLRNSDIAEPERIGTAKGFAGGSEKVADVVIRDRTSRVGATNGVDLRVRGCQRVLAEDTSDHGSVAEDGAEDRVPCPALGLKVHLFPVLLAHEGDRDVSCAGKEIGGRP
jgi:hypothetical protein